MKLSQASPPSPMVMSRISLCKAIPLSIIGVSGDTVDIKSYISENFILNDVRTCQVYMKYC